MLQDECRVIYSYVSAISAALILSCFSIAFFAGETDNFVKVLQNHRSIKMYQNFDYGHRCRQYVIIF